LYDVSGIDVAEKSTENRNTPKKALEPKQALKRKSVGKSTENKSLETKSQKAPLPLLNR